MTGLQEVRRSPLEIWREIADALAELTVAQGTIDADRARMAEFPTYDEVDTHETRCFDAYLQRTRTADRIAALMHELDGSGIVAEIGGYLGVTYGGRS